MNDHQLTYFVVSAQERSFTRAAQKLFVSQSAITQQIKALEAEVGCTLFARGSRGISLTREGETLYTYAQSVLRTWRDAKAALSESATPDTLHVGYQGYMQNELLPKISRLMRREHPEIAVKYVRYRLSIAEQAMKDDGADLFLSDKRLLWAQSGLHFMPLYMERHYLVMPAEHPLAGAATLSMTQLQAEVLIMPKRKPWLEHIQALYTLPGGEVMDNHIEAEDTLNVISDVLTHGGIAIMPGFCCPNSSSLSIVPLEPDIPFEVGAVYRGKLSAQGKAFCACARAALAGEA